MEYFILERLKGEEMIWRWIEEKRIRVFGKGKMYLSFSPEINLETFDSCWLILNSRLCDDFNQLNNHCSPLGLCRFTLLTFKAEDILKDANKRWKNKGQKVHLECNVLHWFCESIKLLCIFQKTSSRWKKICSK